MSPYAWAKLLFLRDFGPTEVGGFGISSQGDLLMVEDICLVKQLCTEFTVKFDDHSVADYFDQQVDEGLVPEQFARVWIHTHPGNSPVPSRTDEETFARCFGAADWAVMFIVASGGRTYARLRFQAGPVGELVLPVEVDFSGPFPAADHLGWEAEYRHNILLEAELKKADQWFEPSMGFSDPFYGYDPWFDDRPFDGPWVDDPVYGPVPAAVAMEGLYG